jgi:uncharacterized 2Fe-2S/4Fe-4S cluster protein (DUF4445 family)
MKDAEDRVRIELRPLGRSVEVERGTPLRDVLYAYGVEFPCGGRGRCKRCRVKVLDGSLPVTPDEEALLSGRERSQGWRLACHASAQAPVSLQVEQFRAPILTDNSPFDFRPRPGLGVAVDLGTTTLVAQLLDLQTGRVLAVHTALNPQAAYGSDIMNRTQVALEETGRAKLRELVRRGVGKLLRRLVTTAELRETPLDTVAVVGNTVMHHLFCDLDVGPLARVPFETETGGLQEFSASELGWKLSGDPVVRFLPCLGGFVGSDILAGVLATRMQESDALLALVDLGTNGEIVLGTAERMLCASTAAGPAFEAGGIQMGMQATTGAIDQVSAVDGALRCRVLVGWIQTSGRLAEGRKVLPLRDPVHLTQGDIRQLQLAKAAIAAGIRILLDRWGAEPGDVRCLNLAGAFGNYVNRTSARRIGLIDFPDEKVEAVGNTALLGAKLALFGADRETYRFSATCGRIEHLSLAADPHFQEIFLGETGFPA